VVLHPDSSTTCLNKELQNLYFVAVKGRIEMTIVKRKTKLKPSINGVW
jgi:hypothetical protein